MAGFPTFVAPPLGGSIEPPPVVPYGDAPAFDFVAGDFIVDGAGRTVMVDGYRAFVEWCAKTAVTERYQYPIYSAQYGVELEAARLAGSRSEFEAQVQRTEREALMVSARTQSVTEFVFDWHDDGVDVSFVVTPVVGAPFVVRLTVPIA